MCQSGGASAQGHDSDTLWYTYLALVDVEAKVLADARERLEEVVPYFRFVTRCLAASVVSQRATSLRGQRGYQGGGTQATCARKTFGVRPSAARDPIPLGGKARTKKRKSRASIIAKRI